MSVIGQGGLSTCHPHSALNFFDPPQKRREEGRWQMKTRIVTRMHVDWNKCGMVEDGLGMHVETNCGM